MKLINLIGAFVVVLIGLYLFPTVRESFIIYSEGNFTGAASTIISMTTIFFSVSILLAGLGLVYSSLKFTGLISGFKNYEFDDEVDEDEIIDEKDIKDIISKGRLASLKRSVSSASMPLFSKIFIILILLLLLGLFLLNYFGVI